LRDAIRAAAFPTAKMLIGVKAFDFATDAYIHIGSVPVLNETDSGFALFDIRPGFVYRVPHRRQYAHPGDHDPPFLHLDISPNDSRETTRL
jgi:hypothetical protein